jgi:hypothetical protein
MHDLLHKYNGQHAAHGHYNFKSITMHSSGDRDPDSEGTSGISGSKMREHAASGNKAEFHANAPSKMKPEHKDAMYNDLRKGMNLKEETVQETLRPEMGASHYIDDFIKSTNPRFNNKSKAERRRMAIGAYMAAKARGVKEEVQIDELSTDLLARYKTASAASAKAADASGNYAKGDKRFKGINKATTKQFDNDLKKHGQMKEGTLQGNLGGGDAMNTSTSAPSASTSKDTTVGKKIKGFKFFNGENDKQMNMNQPVKEGYQSHSGRSHGNPYGGGGFGKREREDDEYHVPDPTPVAPTIARKYIKGTPENKAAKAASKPINGHPTNEEVEEISELSKTTLGNYYTSAKDDNKANADSRRSGDKDEAKSAKDRYVKRLTGMVAAKQRLNNEEVIDERNKANALMRKTMDASRGAKFKLKNPVPDADPKHKTARDHNVAIGRALRNESMTGNPGNGYHGACGTADEKYEEMHKHVKNLTDGDDKTVKHYLDSGHGEKLAGREEDHDHIKSDFKKFMKYYRPEMNTSKPVVQEAAVQKGVNVDDVNAAGQEPHEEKWEPAKKVTKLKKVKEESMKSYKEFLQALDEKLIGGQKNLDKNKNGKVDKNDFELLRKEEVELDESTYADAEKAKSVAAALKQKHNDGNYSVKQTKNGHKVVHAYHGDTKVKNQCKSMNEELEQIDEIKMADVPSRMIKGKSYGADYEDPEGAFETKKDMKKPEKAGRKAGAGAGVYKPRKTMSKLKAAGATYK